MGLKAHIKKVGLVLSIFVIAISSNLFFLPPKPTLAAPAPNSWVNRQSIFYGGAYYDDINTFDNNYTYESRNPVAGCGQRDKLVFSVHTPTPAFGLDGDFFYYDGDSYNNAAANPTHFVYTPNTCFENTRALTAPLGAIQNRRITFVRDGNDTLVSVTRPGLTFNRSAQFNNQLVYGADPDTICKDAITINGNEGGLYAARQVNINDSGGRDASALMDVVGTRNLSNTTKCTYVDDDLEGPGSKYAIIQGSNAGVLGAPYKIYIGTADLNLVPDGAGGNTPTPPGGACTIPGKSHFSADDTNNCVPDPAQVCRAADTGIGNALSWVICPLTDLISRGVGIAEDFVTSLLTINPLQVDSDIYRLWDAIRNFANVIFAIMFLVIIFSAATGFGVGNLSIKKTLPTLFGAVVISNISFFPLALSVDAINIAQEGISNLAALIAPPVSVPTTGGGTESATGGHYLALATVVIGAALLIPGAAGFMIGFIITAALVILVAVLCLVFRHFLIVGIAAAFPIFLLSRKGFQWALSNFGKALILGPIAVFLFAIGDILAAYFGGLDPTPDGNLSTFDEIIQMTITLLLAVLPLLGIPVVMLMGGALIAKAYGMLTKGAEAARKTTGAGWQSAKGVIADKGSASSNRFFRGAARVATGTVGIQGGRRMAAMGAERADRVRKLQEAQTTYTLNRKDVLGSANARDIIAGLQGMKLEDIGKLKAGTVKSLLTHSDAGVRTAARDLFTRALSIPDIQKSMKHDQVATMNNPVAGMVPPPPYERVDVGLVAPNLAPMAYVVPPSYNRRQKIGRWFVGRTRGPGWPNP